MKTKLLLIITILLLSYSLQMKAQQWEYVNSPTRDAWMQKVCAQGLDTVYIVGENGLIAKSADRALTWSKQNFTTNDLNDIIFINHNIGFAVGSNGTILRTIDAGVNWTQQTSGTTYNLNAIAATGLDNVWTVGDNGTILFSKDSGNTWQLKNLSISSKLNDISFRNGNGRIVGNNYNYLISIDSGNSWTTQNLNIYNPWNQSVDTYHLLSVSQTPNHIYVLYGAGDNDTFIGSGLSIDNNSTFFPSTPTHYFTSFAMVNDSTGYGFWEDILDILTIRIQKIMINNKSSEYFSNPIIPSNAYLFMYTHHSDMCIVNDTVGYVVSGLTVFRLVKKSTVQGTNGLNTIQCDQNNIQLKYHSDELMIQSQEKQITDVEIYNMDGIKVNQRAEIQNNNCRINVVNLPLGTYLIRTTCMDNTSNITKWIKQ